MQGYLARLGYRIQQCHIRESMARTDPLGMISTWYNTVQRREYSVALPNQLWHIDGNNRLIRYAFANCISRDPFGIYESVPCLELFKHCMYMNIPVGSESCMPGLKCEIWV